MINTLYTKSAILFGAISLAGGATGQDVTNLEREQALHYLAETRAGVIEAVKGLSDAQFNFKPAPDRWSVAECLEHIAIVEDLTLNGIRPRLEKGAAPAADRDVKQIDAMVLAKVPDRSTKVQAPPQLHPTGRQTPATTLEHFLASRQQTVNWLKSDSDLRGHVVDHPVLGPLDGYQWILAVAAHSERHTKQILEVKTDPNFPRTEEPKN
jgi:DinB superfamily